MRISPLLYPTLACLAFALSSPVLGQNAETLAHFAKEPHTGPVEQTIIGVTTVFRSKQNEVIEVRAKRFLRAG